MVFDEFADCLEWWNNRKENDRAWKIAAKDSLKYEESGALISVNLDINNPNHKEDFEHLPPEKLLEDVFSKEQRILELLTEIRNSLYVIE